MAHVAGLSIMQNGKVPTFIDEEIKKRIFSAEEPSEACISELRDGLKKVGIYQVSSELIFIDQLLYKICIQI